MTTEPLPDVIISYHGSIVLVHPATEEGRTWLTNHLNDETQYLGDAAVVEPRYLPLILEGMLQDGLLVH
jgi:hypothetical protein